MLRLFIHVSNTMRRSHLEDARRDDEHLKADVVTEIFTELLGSVTSLCDDLAFIIESRCFEFDGLHKLLWLEPPRTTLRAGSDPIHSLLLRHQFHLPRSLQKFSAVRVPVGFHLWEQKPEQAQM